MTKQERKYIAMYEHSKDFELHHIYKTYSTKKAIAYNNCRIKCEEEKGQKFRIISHNQNVFTVAWIMPDYTLHVVTAHKDIYIDYLPF